MTTWFVLGIVFFTCFILYFTSRLIIWSMSILMYLIVVYYSNLEINPVIFSLITILYLSIVGIFNIKYLRQFIISKIIFQKARGLLPKISETEQLALNAGDTWYEKEIFQGKPNFHKLHNLKKFELSVEEKNFITHETNELCKMLDDWQITFIEKDLPIAVWNYLRDKNFFGLVIAKEYGGKGFSAAAHSEIVMKIATRSISAAVTVMVPNSLGPGELLQHYGTDEQKEYYLPRLANGTDIPCFALTSIYAGSDATSISDEGVVCMGEYGGIKQLGIMLKNVNKRYITLAPIATLVGLAFKLKDPDGLLNAIGKEGITCALLPHDHNGLNIGNRLLPLDQVFMNGTVKIKQSFIPITWIIGGQIMAGEGWRMLVECLAIGRSISLPACGTASALVAVISSSAYSMVREQFKVTIGSFEGIEDKLAKMAGLAYISNATRQFTVSAVDVGLRPSVASAIAKYHLTEHGRSAVTHAMDVHAGRGIIMGKNNYLARAYEGSPIGITVEGANIMTRNLMIFGQGAMRCHPFIRQEYESLNTIDGLSKFDKAMFGHIGYHLHNFIRAVFTTMTAGYFATGYIGSKFNNYYKKISRLSNYFAYVSDVALITLGGELKRRERISARLGDVMSYLYMACATLKYYEDNGRQDSDEVFVKWSLDHCLYMAQNSLVNTLDNFIWEKLGKVLKFLFFPCGVPYKEPSDKLEHQLSVNLLSNSATRENLKNTACVFEDESDPIGRVELAFKAALDIIPVKNKIHHAIAMHQLPKGSAFNLAKRALDEGIIKEYEFKQLQLSQKLTDAVIQVDEFAPFELGPKNAHPSWSMK